MGKSSSSFGVIRFLTGAFMLIGGGWLAAIGGSWYYVIGGVVMLSPVAKALRWFFNWHPDLGRMGSRY